MLTQEDKIDVELIKKTMTKKKTTLPSLRRQNWKKDRNRKDKQIIDIPTCTITELNELIYAGVRLVGDKIGVPLKNSNRNTKPGWEIWLDELDNKQKCLGRKIMQGYVGLKRLKQNRSLTLQLEGMN